MPPELVTPPGAVVTPAEAKTVSPALVSLSDEQVAQLLASATGMIDGPFGLLKKCVGQQTWRQDYAGRQPLYRLPMLGGVTVTKAFVGDSELDLSAVEVRQDEIGVYVASSHALTRIEFKAGFDVVPQNIKMAIILVAADIHAKVSEQGNLRSFEAYQAYTEQYSSPEVMSAATMRTVRALLGRRVGMTYA